MSLPFNQDGSLNSKYFECDGDQYMFVGFTSTGYKAIDTIDEFRSLTTNIKYTVPRKALISRMIEKNAKIILPSKI